MGMACLQLELWLSVLAHHAHAVHNVYWKVPASTSEVFAESESVCIARDYLSHQRLHASAKENLV